MKRPSLQFYPGDWRRDSRLQSCSIGARGVWIEMMCIMHDSEPYGHLQVGDKVISADNLARMIGCRPKMVAAFIAELEGAGVFSRTEGGVIFSRRMVKDEAVRNKRAAGGKLGGNPTLINTGKDNHKDNLQNAQTDNHADKQTVADEDADEESSGVRGARGVKMAATQIPPPVEWVVAFGSRMMLPEAECVKFFEWHEARGWVVKGSRIYNWQSAMTSWNSNFRSGTFTPKDKQNGKPKSPSVDEYSAAMRAARKTPDNAAEIIERDRKARDARYNRGDQDSNFADAG